MLIMFVVKYDSPEEMSLETIVSAGGNPKLLQQIYGNECYKKAAMSWLPFLNERGFLDTML